MDNYIRNKYCPCVRCRMNCMMGPAILITLGVMFLLNNLHVARGGTLVAVLLIVIGGVKLLQSSAPTDGHIQPTWVYPGAPDTQVPPPPSAGQTPAGQVNNG